MTNNGWDYDYSELYRNAQRSRTDRNAEPYDATGTEQPDAAASSTAWHGTPYGASYQTAAPAAKKGKGTGKRVAAAALAVVLCGAVGVGGGYLGGTLAAKNNQPTTVINQVTADGSTGTVATATDAMTTSQIADLVAPSVVEVTTESVTTNSFFGQYVTDGAGSGVIISADGYILTNNHVVSGAQQIKVTLNDKTQYTATLVGTDTKTDMAVLKVDAKNLTPATLGDSDALHVGDFCIAVGNPLGTLGGTVTDGIISALNREVTIDNQTMTLLQMNAAVSPGNSGGGLFNSQGQLVGIVNAKSSSTNAEGLGFAIPVNTAVAVSTELMNNGYVTGRPALGINVIAISDAQTAAQYGVTRAGVYVATVNAGSSAEKAGIQKGDLIMSMNGTAVSQTSDLTTMLDGMSVGDEVEMQIIRGEKVLTVTLTLQERSADADSQAKAATESDTQTPQTPNAQGGTAPNTGSDRDLYEYFFGNQG